jgi:serine/threonine-protein phosphatase 2B catalytic subunit
VESSIRRREEYVDAPSCMDHELIHTIVTDMLVAVLNTCTKEELEEEEEDEPLVPEPTATTSLDQVAEAAERRKAIKSKIMAVGRMARVFALLREESERVSELKNVTGSTKLPYGTLAFGAEGIKDAISGFDDAYVHPIFIW